MRFVVLGLGLVFSLTACNEEDLLRSIVGSAPVPPNGAYESQCKNSENSTESTISIIEINDGNYISTMETFALPDCEGVVASSEVTEGSADFKGIDLGSNVSFVEMDESGIVVYAPYLFFDNYLYIGAKIQDVNNPEDIFSDFVDSPMENAVIIYTRITN